jgi:hypothetical protein
LKTLPGEFHKRQTRPLGSNLQMLVFVRFPEPRLPFGRVRPSARIAQKKRRGLPRRSQSR